MPKSLADIHHVMKSIEDVRTRKALEIFSTVFLLVWVLVLPKLGGTAMMVGSAFAMCVYTFYFKEIMRDRRGSLVPAVCLTLFLVVVAATAVVVSLIQWIRD
jgi:hypothetical protein